jgi:hypothetical protein
MALLLHNMHSSRMIGASTCTCRYDNLTMEFDTGVCHALLEEAESVPILGVCLGMQALAHVHGGQVVSAPQPIHGRLSEIRHSSNPLFAGIPSGHLPFGLILHRSPVPVLIQFDGHLRPVLTLPNTVKSEGCCRPLADPALWC